MKPMTGSYPAEPRTAVRPAHRGGWIAFLLAAIATAGCGPLEEDLCDFKCDCEGCSDREYDDCVDHYDDDFRRADNSGCPELYDDWLACQDETGRCDGSDWEDSCKSEHERYKDCVD